MLKTIARGYLTAKRVWSLWLGRTVYWQRAPLPSLGSAVEVMHFVGLLKYTGDGPFGLLDHVHGAEFLCWHIRESVFAGGKEVYRGWPMIDCDDYAELAVALFLKMGWFATRVVLVDRRVVKSHVVCAFYQRIGDSLGTVDTNGLRWWKDEEAMVAGFGKMYDCEYTMVKE